MRKTDIHVASETHGTALHIACSEGNIDAVRLLYHDADVGTPLQEAVRARITLSSELDCLVRYLIDDAKADVDFIGHRDCALNIACLYSSSSIVNLLLEKHANPNSPDDQGRYAIHFAAMQAILDGGGDMAKKDKLGRTALHWAANGGIRDIVEFVYYLIPQSLDEEDSDCWTPLMCGCACIWCFGLSATFYLDFRLRRDDQFPTQARCTYKQEG